ncbi:hypothetical protein FRC12_014573 [Ceratobasidium sp. 428]|nr:hypothetical protein FRC12_014573 [Ceratobasidium sp. 428]
MPLIHLGAIHWAQFQKLGELTSLDAVIECQTKLITLTPDGDPKKLSLLNNLYVSTNIRFQRLKALTDLDTLIKCQTGLIALGSDRLTCLNCLGDLFNSRFQLRHDFADLETSIEHHAEALLLTPMSHPAKPGRLSALGQSFLDKYARQGKPADIDASIEYLLEALRLTPEGCFDRSIRLNHLGKAFRGRFDVLGELKDLDKAIKYHTEAVLLIPDGHSDKLAGLSTLGVSHYTRFRRLGEFTDLNAALKYYTEAVQLTPDQHPGKPGRLNHLGGALLVRFRRLGELTDMNMALEHLTKAVKLTPDGDPGLPTYLDRIGLSLHARFHKLNNSADLESAIDYHRKAVHLLPDDDPTGIERLRNLGMSHLCRFERLKNQIDFVEAMGYFRRAANSSTASPNDKIMLAALWAFSSQHDLPGCIEAYGYAVRFIPQVAWLGLTVDRRYEELATWATLPSQAAATAIQSREYTLALEWLEECRSVVWSQMLQLRNPLDQLRSVDAQLADDLKQVAGVLDSIGLSNPYQSNTLDSQISIERTAREYRSHASRWEDLVGKARRVPGLERFLLPKKLSELTKSTYNGTVVTINVHDSRCDALALRPGSSEVVHIPLLSVSRKQCIDMRNRLCTALRENNIRARGLRRPVFETQEATDIFKDVLATLWADVVRPILDTLGLLKNAQYRELPLVAWCCTGPLAFLPLHAAGYYSEPRERTFDYIISSYTPTLDTLLKSSPAPDEFGGILAVGQASQFSYAPLPGTVTVLDVIQKQAKNLKFTRIVEEDATPGAVLTAMQQHSWIHLACHASQDISDPTTSAFQLHGGNLDLATITRKPLPNAELAFLSACETATGDEKTPDEAVHLAAGMLMSGYRTVIATMWSIRDEDAPVIAEHFYSRLFEGEIPNSGKAAQSLHDAVGHLRATIGEKEFSRWVPYIHMGQ